MLGCPSCFNSSAYEKKKKQDVNIFPLMTLFDTYLKVRTLLLLCRQLTEYNLFGDKVVLLAFWRVTELAQECGTKVSAADTLKFLELFFIGRLVVVLLRCFQRTGCCARVLHWRQAFIVN